MARSSTEARYETVSIDEITRGWPDENKQVVQKLIDKYGPPQTASAECVVWHGNSPWKRTTVYRSEVSHNFPMPHKDFLEQVVDYQVPIDKFDDLARFDGSVYPDRTGGTMAAKCHMEVANMIALNLAHDIITGSKTVEQAREQYGQEMKQHMAGKSTPYAQSLQFQQESGAGDPDKAMSG